jgi:hypothetical protein
VEQPREFPLAVLMSLREEAAQTRATVQHLVADLGEVKQDLRRLDDRIFQVLLVQFGTLAAALGAVAAALVAALRV